MELRRYALILWRWSWLIVLGTVLAGGAAYMVSKRQMPVYQGSALLLVSPSKAQVLDLNASYYDATQLSATYAELLRSRPVLEEVIHHLGLPQTPAALAAAISAQPVRNTQLIRLSAEDISPARAAAIANEIPKVFIAQNDEMQTRRFAESKASLQRQLQDTQAQIDTLQASVSTLQADKNADMAVLDRQQRDLHDLQNSYTSLFQSYEELRVDEAKQLDTILVSEPAVAPAGPIRPKTAQNTLLAAVVGALLALGIAYTLEYMDDVLKNPEDVQASLGLAALGVVPALDGGGKTDLPAMHSNHSPATEAYRVLRTNLQFASVGGPLRSLLITSPSPAEGKSMTVANVGVALAQAGKGVILVDTDLRRPRLNRIFGLPNSTGLVSALLEENVRLDELLQPTPVPGLRVLTSGPLPPNPAEILGSSRMRKLLADLGQEADMVILDSPPTMALADAAILASEVDGVLLVGDAARTRRDMAVRAVAGLQQVQARLIGAVINRVPTRGAGSYYYYYYYRHYYSHYGTDDGSGTRGGRGGSGGGGARLRRTLRGLFGSSARRVPAPVVAPTPAPARAAPMQTPSGSKRKPNGEAASAR